jgi:hypothetical protein
MAVNISITDTIAVGDETDMSTRVATNSRKGDMVVGWMPLSAGQVVGFHRPGVVSAMIATIWCQPLLGGQEDPTLTMEEKIS